MKIKQQDYEIIKAAAIIVKDKNPAITPQTYKINKIGKDTDMRFRWDLYWSCQKQIPADEWKRINNYLENTHVDTALKNIVKELY